MMINPASFEPNGITNGYAVDGTVNVTIAGETRRMAGSRVGGRIMVQGVNGSFGRSRKAWPLKIVRDGGHEWVEVHVWPVPSRLRDRVPDVIRFGMVI